MDAKSKTTGILLLAAGFTLAVPLTYAAATLDPDEFLRMLRVMVALLFASLGVLVAATGALILAGGAGRRGGST